MKTYVVVDVFSLGTKWGNASSFTFIPLYTQV